MLLSSASLSLLCVPFLEIVAVVSWLWRYTTSPHPAQVDPLYALTFIHTFLNTLIEYFGEVTAPVLRSQGQLWWSQTLCATSFSLHLLSANTLFVTGVSGPSEPSTNNLSAFYSLISWRKAGFRYKYNDIVETLGAVVNKNGTIVTSSVLGKIDVNCKLSGAAFLVPLPLPTCDLISALFRPTRRAFLAHGIRFDFSARKPGTVPALTAAAAVELKVQVPFTLRASLSIDHGGPSFLPALNNRLTVNIPITGVLKDVAIELYLGSSATAATCTGASGCGWVYMPARRTLRWSLAPSASTISGSACSGSAPGRSAEKCTRASRAWRRSRSPSLGRAAQRAEDRSA
ncbi:hypothetical protein H4582DRAFT_147709 [Lactarius indigo]|nr:hypothetical protein H4582DRAFT_147709 [Lactarius indigo]